MHCFSYFGNRLEELEEVREEYPKRRSLRRKYLNCARLLYSTPLIDQPKKTVLARHHLYFRTNFTNRFFSSSSTAEKAERDLHKVSAVPEAGQL